jgi:hypothetical protein
MNNKLINFKLYDIYYDFMVYCYNLLRKYPVSERYFLTGDIKQIVNEVIKIIIKINSERDNKKKIGYLQNIINSYNLMLVFFRLSYKEKFITKTNYAAVSRKLTVLNNITLGVIKSCKV